LSSAHRLEKFIRRVYQSKLAEKLAQFLLLASSSGHMDEAVDTVKPS